MENKFDEHNYYDENDSKNMSTYVVIYSNLVSDKIIPIGERDLTQVEQDSIDDIMMMIGVLEDQIAYAKQIFEVAYRFGKVLGDNEEALQVMFAAYKQLVVMRLENIVRPSLVATLEDPEILVNSLKDEETKFDNISREVKQIKTESEAVKYAMENRLNSDKMMVCSALYYSKLSLFVYDEELLVFKGVQRTYMDLIRSDDRGIYNMMLDVLYDYLNPEEKLALRLVCKFGRYLYNAVLDEQKKSLVGRILMLSLRSSVDDRKLLMVNIKNRKLITKNLVNLAGNLMSIGELDDPTIFMVDSISDINYYDNMHPKLVAAIDRVFESLPLSYKRLIFDRRDVGKLNLYSSAVMLGDWITLEVQLNLKLDPSRRARLIADRNTLRGYSMFGIILNRILGCSVRRRQIVSNLVEFRGKSILENQSYDPFKNKGQESIRNCIELKRKLISGDDDGDIHFDNLKNHHCPYYEVAYNSFQSDHRSYRFFPEKDDD